MFAAKHRVASQPIILKPLGDVAITKAVATFRMLPTESFSSSVFKLVGRTVVVPFATPVILVHRRASRGN